MFRKMEVDSQCNLVLRYALITANYIPMDNFLFYSCSNIYFSSQNIDLCSSSFFRRTRTWYLFFTELLIIFALCFCRWQLIFLGSQREQCGRIVFFLKKKKLFLRKNLENLSKISIFNKINSIFYFLFYFYFLDYNINMLLKQILQTSACMYLLER